MRSIPAALLLALCSATHAFADADLAACRGASERGDFDAAIEGCTEALDGKLSGDLLVKALDLRASAYLDKKQYELAIKDYDQVIRLDPTYPLPYLNRGMAHRAMGNIDAAIQDYNTAIKITPGIALAYNNRGNAYRDKGEYDLAIKDFDLAIKLEPKDARLYNNRGGAYHGKNDSERAIADYSRAIELAPSLAVAHMDRGLLLNTKGEFTRALQDGANGIGLEPDDPIGWWVKGAAEFGLARYEAAATTLADFVDRKPDDPYGILLLHAARTRAGEAGTDRLRTHAEQFDLSKWPGPVLRYLLGELSKDDVVKAAGTNQGPHCDVAFYLGQELLAGGDKDAARVMMRTAMDMCPATFVEHALARAELSRL
jgi:tetratricopeptide (TPR) repeat protein